MQIPIDIRHAFWHSHTMKGTLHITKAKTLHENYMKSIQEPTQSTLEKLRLMFQGTLVVMSDDELDTLCQLDVSNVIRTRPNPNQIGTLDRWEAWVERKDIERLSNT